MKRIAIIQSSYIPWRGFFDLIDRCDLYVIYDTAAFSKGHWHNRNRIKRASGDSWLSIPVKTASKLSALELLAKITQLVRAEPANQQAIQIIVREAPTRVEPTVSIGQLRPEWE